MSAHRGNARLIGVGCILFLVAVIYLNATNFEIIPDWLVPVALGVAAVFLVLKWIVDGYRYDDNEPA